MRLGEWIARSAALYLFAYAVLGIGVVIGSVVAATTLWSLGFCK